MRTANKLVENLNTIMEFDHVIEVTPEQRVVHRADLYSPEVVDEEILSDRWEWMDGYSGQDRYSGPIMHASEFIGGGMARDIAENPGVYVAVVVECDHNPEYCDDPEDCSGEPIGWGVLRMKENDE